MQRSNPAAVVTVPAPAKLNLSLSVLSRRDDGYHAIESLIVPVSLCDTVRVEATEEPGIRLRVRFGGRLARAAAGELATDVPVDASNLAVRAAEALAAEAGLAPAPGLAIDLVKRIPSGSGLGGGSSDAAAVLVAAAAAWGMDRSRESLLEVAASLGSDVPVFVAGGAAVVTGRGERIEPVAGIPPLHAVIARPSAGLSTAAVYARCTPDPSRVGTSRLLAEALARGDLRQALPLVHNGLEDAARQSCPEVDRLLGDFARAGAVRPLLTGSGSACFALVRSAAESRLVAARLRSRGWPAVFRVRLDPRR